METCKSCHASIVWVRTMNGKSMPCDPAEVTIVTGAGETIRGRIPHWATCPTREQHRKPADPQLALGVKP